MTDQANHPAPVDHRLDETATPLLFVALLLVVDIVFSSAAAPPGHNHLEPFDSGLKAVLMLVIAAIAYVRPVEYGAQLLEAGRFLAGLSWLTITLGAPFLLLMSLPISTPQTGLVATLVCAIIANIITKSVTPIAPDP